MDSAVEKDRIAVLERENRILHKKLARSEANRALLEEALESHIEALKIRNAEIREERNAYHELNVKLRTEIEAEYQEKAKVNEKLYKLDRLNIVGEMAASIGHEVRNPLTTVRGFLQFFAGKAGFSDYKDDLGLMIEELDRANSIITEFLSLAKNKRIELQPGSLKKSLLTIRPMLEIDAISRGHVLEFALEDTPDILMNENEIRQLLINLVRNGLEAMATPGLLIVSLKVSGDEVLLSVRDFGRGIPQGVLAKLGTPFFTTKDNGSGLGLAVSYRIMERHHAFLSFEDSKPGTTVTARFQSVQSELK